MFPTPTPSSLPLYGATACKYNQVSVPLEQATLTIRTTLATSMGGRSNVSQVLRWDATRQAYDQWFPRTVMVLSVECTPRTHRRCRSVILMWCACWQAPKR